MNVANRKLFTNRDARAKLSSMGGIMASSPELLGEVQKFAKAGSVDVPETDTGIKDNLISKYLKAMTENPKPADQSQEFYESRLKTYLFNFIVGSSEVTPELREYANRLINDAISDIDPEAIKRQTNQSFETGNFFSEAGALNDRVSTLAFLQDRSPSDFTFDNSVVDSLGARSFRDDDQAAAVAQEFVAMPTPNMELSPSNVAPSVTDSPVAYRREPIESQSLSSEAMINQQAPRPTVPELEAPSMGEMPLVEPPAPDPDRTRTLGDIVAENPRTPERDAMFNALKEKFSGFFGSAEQPFIFSDTTGVSRDGRTNAEILAQAQALMPQASIPNRVEEIVAPVEAQVRNFTDIKPGQGYGTEAFGPGNTFTSGPQLDLTESEELINVPPERGSAINDYMRRLMSPVAESISEVVKPIGEAAQEFADPLKIAIDRGRDGQRFDPLTTLFNQTIENQKQAMPGGVNISEYRENLENNLSSVEGLETIQVGNMSYLYDRASGTAYRMGGDPITATEQDSVDRILTSNEPAGFGTFSTDSPTPQEMLNAPIEASQQVIDTKIRKQEELVSSMDPKNTTFAERVAERKTLEELKNTPPVTAANVGTNTPVLTQKEAQDLELGDPGVGGPDVNIEDVDAAIADAEKSNNDLIPSNLIDITKVVTAIDNNESTSDALVSGVTGTNQNLTPKESVKAYQAIFKEMLGVDDEDKEKEKYHQMAMIGFAIAAGQDPNALSNVAGGLLEGTKLARKDRKDKKALMAKVNMAAFDAARQDTQRSEDLANRITLAEMKTTSTESKLTPFEKALQNEVDSIRKASIRTIPDADAYNQAAINLQKMAPYKDRATAFLTGGGNPAPTLTVPQQIKKLQDAGKSDAYIKEQLIRVGQDPSIYGIGGV